MAAPQVILNQPGDKTELIVFEALFPGRTHQFRVEFPVNEATQERFILRTLVRHSAAYLDPARWSRQVFR
jgi:hypothetical protein